MLAAPKVPRKRYSEIQNDRLVAQPDCTDGGRRLGLEVIHSQVVVEILELQY